MIYDVSCNDKAVQLLYVTSQVRLLRYLVIYQVSVYNLWCITPLRVYGRNHGCM